MQPQAPRTFPRSERNHTGERFAPDVPSDGFSIRSEISIHADTRRLFHALTDPEYLEAWLCIPGHGPACSISVARYDSDYVIEPSVDGGQSIVISGRYLVLRRRHVMFSWRVSGNICVPESEVEIRLLGDFGRTTLALRHSGFASRRDSAWHQALWRASIGRLASLYGAPDRPHFSSGRDREVIGQLKNLSGFGGPREANGS